MAANDRIEVDAFVSGALFACHVMCRALGKNNISVDVFMGDMSEAARALYPPYDPYPEPTKALRKGMKEPW